MSINELPSPLRTLIRDTMVVLGEEFAKSHGKEVHKRLLNVRTRMTQLRGKSTQSHYQSLQKLHAEFKNLSNAERSSLAHGFSLMMEVTNICENAYRSHRLAEQDANFVPTHHTTRLIWVLTAHPTESRTPESLGVLHGLQQTLVNMLKRQWDSDRVQLRAHLRSLCDLPLAPSQKPLPPDEARTLFTAALRSENLDVLTRAGNTPKCRLRTWAGGDKDGHPGVGAKELRASLQISREFILKHVANILNDMQPHFALHAPQQLPEFLRLQKELQTLKKMRDGDFKLVSDYRTRWHRLWHKAKVPPEILSPHLSRFQGITSQFPAWVLPLELRESSDKIHEAWEKRKLKRPPAINQMLSALKALGGKDGVLHYARALVVSMTHTSKDLIAAQNLSRLQLGSYVIPVVPLFETVAALQSAPQILKEYSENSSEARLALNKLGFSDVEIMLGYSDSSKECGVLYSRLLIKDAMGQIEKDCAKLKLRPLFFHGSGGSVARGGGNLSEITSGWSRNALENYKTTLQGEVVSRTFSSPEILAGQVHKLRHLQEMPATKSSNPSPALKAWAMKARESYQGLVSSPDFLKLVQQGTLYPHLHHLRIGSRPSKRATLTGVQDLRAIPWVMCWTQSRLLFPTWWGLGSAWTELTPAEKKSLKHSFKNKDPFLTAFVKQLGFTLAKVEMGVWKFQENQLTGETSPTWERELRACMKAFTELTGGKDLMWFRPWLRESIHMRSPLIHPLNVLQVIAVQKQDGKLLRQTVTGIASGMMTTG